jgi:aminomethyltransferase
MSTTDGAAAPGPGPSADGGPLRTPLHDEHVALGASMTDFAGWSMPLRYGSDVAEHHAVRTAAGLFDLSHMAELRVRGPGAGRALDRALVGALSTLAVGRARYTMLCRPDGGVVDDLIVYRTGDEDLLVVANAANAPTVANLLRERCAGEGVEVVDETTGTALVAVQGPAAADILAGLVADPAERDAVVGLRYYASTTATVGAGQTVGTGPTAGAAPTAVRALVARTGYTGEDGFELFVPADDAVGLWRALLSAGGPRGLVPAGLAARDTLRLEAGMPLYGQELTQEATPYDAGLHRVVRLDKTDDDGAPVDFVGREALAARAEAAPTRVLVGLVGLGRRAARPGHVVTTADGARPVGKVTSGAPSPTLGHPIAMAYVTPEVTGEGTELGVDVRGRTEPVRVVPLPFYRRP